MLTRLSVSNFAIIDQLDLEFKPGLTIITGETGAGKSILLGALRLILGERANTKLLNDTEKKSIIEAVIDISNQNLKSFFENNDLDYEQESIFRRELLPGGKSRAFINDTPVTLKILETIGEQLIDIHSQFNTSNLLHKDFQLKILDAYAGQLSILDSYREKYTQFKKESQHLAELSEKLEEKSRETDYNQFLLEELETAQIIEGEIDELENEQKELQNIEEIQQTLQEVSTTLEGAEYGVLNLIEEIAEELKKIANWGSNLKDFSERMDSVKIELRDLYTEISSRSEDLEAQPERLTVVSERLNLIHQLLHKHKAVNEEELLKIKDTLKTGKTDFENLENEIEEKKVLIKELKNILHKEAGKISDGRKKVIPKIEKELIKILETLGMENAIMKIDLEIKNEPGADGKNDVLFLFTANKGSKLQPLSETASGGEQSRVMLAIKKIMAGKLNLPTLILDEIDTGVSGKVANEVGNLMKEMAQNLQVISITHLPQVAAKADQQFKVRKSTDKNKTFTEVVALNKEERIREIAELISGYKVTDAALDQAKKLIEA